MVKDRFAGTMNLTAITDALLAEELVSPSRKFLKITLRGSQLSLYSCHMLKTVTWVEFNGLTWVLFKVIETKKASFPTVIKMPFSLITCENVRLSSSNGLNYSIENA